MSVKRRPQLGIETGAALIGTAFSAILLVLTAMNAGPLWRDETNTFNLAHMPSLRDIWRNLPFESCPLLWPLLVRGCGMLGLTDGDMGIRILGLGIGLFFLTSLWLCQRWIGGRTPILSIALLGGLPAFIFIVGANRAYGLAGCLLVLSFGKIWRVLESPTKSRILWPNVPEDDANSAVFFAGTALIAGLIGFFIFLWITKMPTQIWYFLPLTTFAGVCIDAALANWPARWQLWHWAVPLLALGCLPGAREFAASRQTNMDLIASVLRERTHAHDLIIVHPWTFGVSFDRQYSGSTPWTTVPPLADHRFHRYDLFKEKMVLANPVQPVFDRIAATLRAGNHVWLVGEIPLSQTPPPQIRPAPNNPWGWLDDPYSDVWGAQVGYFVAIHATRGEVIPIHSSNPISPLENVPMVAVTGWQEPPAAPTIGSESTGK